MSDTTEVAYFAPGEQPVNEDGTPPRYFEFMTMQIANGMDDFKVAINGQLLRGVRDLRITMTPDEGRES